MCYYDVEIDISTSRLAKNIDFDLSVPRNKLFGTLAYEMRSSDLNNDYRTLVPMPFD